MTTSELEPRKGNDRPQCPPLMDVAGLDLFSKNGFRITGLPVDATSKEVAKRGEKLKLMEELGHESANTNAFPINPPPSVDDIREAIQRLKDPETRLIDEFFWFWPEGQSSTDEAIQAYVQGKGEQAFNLWIARKAEPDRSAIAYHNLAVVYHLMAIEWTLHFIDGQTEDNTKEKIHAYWTTAIRYWNRTINDDRIWDSMKARIRSLDEQRLTTGLARRIRDVLPEALANINALIAYKLAERGRMNETEAQIKYIKSCGLSVELQDEMFTRILAPLRDRFTQGIQPAANASLDPAKRFEAAKAILAQAPAVSYLFEIFFGKSSHQRTELLDEMAMACAYSSTAYQKATGDLPGFIALSKKAFGYATAVEVRKRVQENVDFGEQQLRRKSIEPFLTELDQIGNSNDSPKVKLSMVKETVMLQVAEFLQQEGPNTPLADDLQTSVAILLRKISLAAYNDHDDIDTAQEATALATKLAKDPDVRKRLAEDQLQLDKNQADELKCRLDLLIRNDHIQVNRQYISYNKTRFQVSEINGIRFGVYRHSTNGIQDSCSYLIGLSSSGGETLKIECKRFFRSENQAKTDYEAILNCLFANVIPGLAMRCAKSIVAGRFQLGESTMSAEGMTLSSGSLFWKKEVFVPYAQIGYVFFQGSLCIAKKGDKSVSRSISVRDTWNAVIFEQLLKAIQIVKTKK